MAFDPSKDVLIDSVEFAGVESSRRLRIAIRSYNGGQAKIAIEQYRAKKDGTGSWWPAKRLSMDEASALSDELFPFLTAVNQDKTE